MAKKNWREKHEKAVTEFGNKLATLLDDTLNDSEYVNIFDVIGVLETHKMIVLKREFDMAESAHMAEQLGELFGSMGDVVEDYSSRG